MDPRGPGTPERSDRAGRAGLSRRRFLTTGLGATAGLAASSWLRLPAALAASDATAPGTSQRLADAFAAPPRAAQAGFRWWWPHGMVDLDEIRNEVDQIAEQGFGRVEIADVHHSVERPLDPAGTGWGTAAWVAALEAALDQASQHGVIVDVTIGPSWPAALPSVTPDDPAACTELAHGVAPVGAGETFDQPVPPPVVAPSEGVTDEELFAVQAFRLADGSTPDERRPTLVADSMLDLTDIVDDGRLTWTAPDEGTWLVLAYWVRGSGQRPERGPHSEPVSYVVDHFSTEGTQAVIDFWEEHLLTPRVRRLLARTGGAMFEDSLEIETDATIWTRRFPAAFEAQHGYSVLPFLPVVIEVDEDPVFRFDSGVDGDVMIDVNDVRSALYLEAHVAPLQAWLHDLGLQLRVQPYGLQTDAVAAAAALDIAEGESLGFNNLDDFRSLAGGRDMGGHRLLSSEAAAVFNGSYRVTWADAARTLSREYAAGVNLAILHGFPYADAPGAPWPGFAAFTPYDGGIGYSEAWGPRQPTWRHADGVADWFARTQLVLQAGVPQVDVAFLRQMGYAGSGFGAAYFSASGVREGWTHEFLSPRLLALPTATVRDGRLAPDGPAFKLLVFEGNAFAGRAETLPVATAERLVALARDGLHVLMVGDWSDPRGLGLSGPAEDARLADAVTELLAQPTVARVATREDIPTGIASLGLAPDVRYAESSSLLHARRRDADADYHYFANASDTEVVDHDVHLPSRRRSQVPYELDAWHGRIRPLARYRRDGETLTVPVRLAPGQSTIVAVARPRWAGEAPSRGLHVTTTDADEVAWDGRRLVVRAREAGAYAASLADGRRVTARIADVAEPQELTHWQLRAEDWRPGASATETEVVVHELVIDALAPWPQLPGLADASGVGRYTTTVELGEAWTGGHRARLELGAFTDTARVWVNGHELPPVDPSAPIVDVGDHLHAGANVFEVEVATTLINRLRTALPDVYGAAGRQDTGLIGPVVLRPYGQTEVGR